MKTSPTAKRTLVIAAWVVMLIVSDLPDILITWLGGSIPAWMFWAKAGFLAVLLGLTLLIKAIRPLWQYALIFLTLFLALGLTNLVRSTAWFQENFNYTRAKAIGQIARVLLLHKCDLSFQRFHQAGG